MRSCSFARHGGGVIAVRARMMAYRNLQMVRFDAERQDLGLVLLPFQRGRHLRRPGKEWLQFARVMLMLMMAVVGVRIGRKALRRNRMDPAWLHRVSCWSCCFVLY